MLAYETSSMSAKDKSALLTRAGFDMSKALSRAQPIVNAVRRGGDRALRRFAREFDAFGRGPLTVPKADVLASKKRIDPELLRALHLSHSRVGRFHSRQRIEPFLFRDSCGEFGQRIIPLRRVGVYVPGGTATYASSVIMACVPARMAGVEEVVVCTPGREGTVEDSVLAACAMCDVDEVHPVGGAHAIAAMAYGTNSIGKVQKIVGPGGAMVSAAKLLVRNDCEIDFLAGPSEVMIVADGRADSRLIAMEMLAQLEHDIYARAVLASSSKSIISKTRQILEELLESTPRRNIASKAAERGAVFVTVPSINAAIDFANEYAPEHLLIDVRNPNGALAQVRNAGSVFLGPHSSVVYGDYTAGTNHVLPTGGSASMRSSLSVYDFLKVIPYQTISAKGAGHLAEGAARLARSEGLHAHAEAAVARAWRDAKCRR